MLLLALSVVRAVPKPAPIYSLRGHCKSCETCVVQELGDILMGKRCDLEVDHGAPWRRFAGEQSFKDLETAVQLAGAG